MKKQISATYLRSKETMKKYMCISKELEEQGISHDPFEYAKENPALILHEFEFWLIIQNNFPYDPVAGVNHMIFPKRKVVFDWKLIHQEEKDEFQKLRETFFRENYDVIYENLPSGQTKPGYFHIHLLKLKRTSPEEFFSKK